MARAVANKAARQGTRPGAGQRRGNGRLLTLSVILLTGMAVAALPLCVLFVAGLPPTAASILVDRHPRRYLARTVGAMNLAGVLPSAYRLWNADMSFTSLMLVISSPYAWLAMYGAAGLGWLLYLGMPLLVGVVGDIRADEQRRTLEARAQALVEEWGPEVTGRAEQE